MRMPAVRLPRGRGARALLAAAVVAVLAAVAAGVLWFSPAMAVRSVHVTGVQRLTDAEVVAALGVGEGTPLLQVDTGAAARRVAGLPRVAEVSVHREFPSTIRVDVTERTAVAYADIDGPRLYDADGVQFASEPPPPGTPKITVPDWSDTALLRTVLSMVAGLPPQLRGQITEVHVGSPSDISFTLGDGRTLRWGDADRSDQKAAVALAVLQQPGQTVDVSSPNLPTTE